ncbi:uncharacterized protein At3g28850-like [Tasmannia lanceolata]|uniref:uncharacterized protein At3g28850-like n=1 Tax=Tasmannia lanceolata TaxID=3420 RepID=UPI0040631CE9
MGCTGSKQVQHDRSNSPFQRSFSLPLHRLAKRKHDINHVVALTSTTLGSLKLDSLESNPNSNVLEDYQLQNNQNYDESFDFSKEVFQAKSWSSMIEEKIPKVPKTPPNEPETVNTWELMAGLEDNYSPLRQSKPPPIDRSFSFHSFSSTTPKPKSPPSPKSVWSHMSPSDSVISDFDPEIISTFRRALEELSPTHSLHLQSPEPINQIVKGNVARCVTKPSNRKSGGRITGIVQARVNAFQEKIDARKFVKQLPAYKCPPHGEDKVVVYFTSLRGVRKTYEDCCRVRGILKGFGVRIDERDVSMHYGFREELREILGDGLAGPLPRVFVNGRYVGGADEVRNMHEVGELHKVLEGCKEQEGGGSICEGCGDVRFVNCETCFGSCKVYYEEEEGFQRCPHCNENGIIRCPLCSS